MHAKVTKSSRDDLYARLLRTGPLWLLLVLAAVLFGILIEVGRPSSDAKAALGLMWQVHASFVSIGFAGLTIAFQILSDPPLAVGSARKAIIEHVRFYPMLLLGIGSNLLIGAAAILDSSDLVVWLAVAVLFVPPLIAIGWAFRRLAKLYSSPIQIEDLTLHALEVAIDDAADDSKADDEAKAAFQGELNSKRGLFARNDLPTVDSRRDHVVTHEGRPGTVEAHIGPLAHAIDFLTHEAIRTYPPDSGGLGAADRPGIYVSVGPGSRAGVGAVLAQIRYPEHVSDACLEVTTRLVRAAFRTLLGEGSSASAAFVSEISSLQDGVLQAIESGLADRTRRGRQYYERIQSYLRFSNHGSGFIDVNSTRLERQLWEIDYAAAQRSRRFAMDASDAALRRAKAAVTASDVTALRIALMTITTIWEGLLEAQMTGARYAREHLLISLHNLAEISIPHSEVSIETRLRAAEQAVWAFVELAKDSIDADEPDSLKRVVGYHSGLYKFAKGAMASVESAVVAGQVALLAWVLYCEERRGGFQHIKASTLRPEPRDDVDLYRVADRLDRNSGGRWLNWESADGFPVKTYTLKFDDYAARATLFYLASGYIPLPPAPSTLKDADTLSWLINHTEGAMKAWLAADHDPSHLTDTIAGLAAALHAWNEAETRKLWAAEIDQDRLATFNEAVRETLMSKDALHRRLKDVPEGALSTSKPFHLAVTNVPKDYFVDVPGTLADPAEVGKALAGGFVAAHDEMALELCLEHGDSKEWTIAELSDRLAETIKPMRSPMLIVRGYSQILDAMGITGDAQEARVGDRSIAVSPTYQELEDGQAVVIDLDRSLNTNLTSRGDADQPFTVKAAAPDEEASGTAVVAVTGTMDMTWLVQPSPAITVVTVTDAEW